jgi:hypothetical protein
MPLAFDFLGCGGDLGVSLSVAMRRGVRAPALEPAANCVRPSALRLHPAWPTG